MKKLYFLIALATISAAASAQIPSQQSLQHWMATRHASNNNTVNRGSTSGTRMYNYVDLRVSETPTIADNSVFPFMWYNYDGISYFSTGYDTVVELSYGMVVQPWYSKFNTLPEFDREFKLERDATYRIDSLTFYGVYIVAAGKANVIDTLVVNAFYADGTAGSTIEKQRVPFPPPSTASLYYGRVGFDPVKKNSKMGINAPANSMVERKILLNPLVHDTTDGGLTIVRVPVNLNVPAGNFIGATYTFKSGDPSFTPYDTIALLGSNNAYKFKYNVFRPLLFEEMPSYNPASDSNYNTGLFVRHPVSNNNGFYGVNFLQQLPFTVYTYMDFFVSSNQFLVGVKDSRLISKVNAYPNPANTAITIPVSLSEVADVKVTLINSIGQVLKMQNLSKVAANTKVDVTFSTNDIANGLYYFTVEAGGQRVSERFVIQH